MITPETFREQIIEVLKLSCSSRAQQEYQDRVPIADVVAEIFCQWEDIYHPKVPTFLIAFEKSEHKALALCEKVCSQIADRIGRTGLDEFHRMPESHIIANAAKRALEALGEDPECTD